jgi:hypothetical protein
VSSRPGRWRSRNNIDPTLTARITRLEPVATLECKTRQSETTTASRHTNEFRHSIQPLGRHVAQDRAMMSASPSAQLAIASIRKKRWQKAHSTGPRSASASHPQATEQIDQPIANAISASAPRIRIHWLMRAYARMECAKPMARLTD